MIAIVTQCFGPDVGGIEALMTGLADHLAAAGWPIDVFADRLRTPGLSELRRPYPIRRFGSIRPLRSRNKLQAIAGAGTFAGAFADSWKSVASAPPNLAPIVMLAHGTEFPADARPEKARRIRLALARSGRVIANSRFTAGLVRDYAQGAEMEIAVINPPIEALPEPEREALAAVDAIIAGRGPVISTLARLEPRKGVDSVISALAEVRGRHPEAVYLVAGEGADRARLEALAAQCGVAGSVAFLGVADARARAALLTRSDIYAMPSRRVGDSVEGYGLAYVEAAWYGAPALAGREGGAVDAVIDGETGLISDGADPADVAGKLMHLADDKALRQRLGANAASRARTQTWDAALPKYLAALGL